MDDQSNKLQDDREAAVREWESQHNKSLVADDRKKRASGIAIGLVAATVLAAVWYMKHGDSAETQKSAAGPDLAIAERKPVPKLKDQPAASVAAAHAGASGPLRRRHRARQTMTPSRPNVSRCKCSAANKNAACWKPA